jgi:hypothetical protein
MTKTFIFNTGVSVYKHSPSVTVVPGNYVNSNGSLVIPFECTDVPDGAIFKFASHFPNLYPNAGYIVRPIVGGNLLSKYAYFTM